MSVLGLIGASAVNPSNIKDKIPGIGGDGDDDDDGLEGEMGDVIGEDDDKDLLINEATTRLQHRGEEITAEKLQEEIQAIKEGEDVDGLTGLLDAPGDRAPVAKLNVSPHKVEKNDKEDYLVIHRAEGDKYFSRTIIVKQYPESVNYGWLDKLVASGLETENADVRVSFSISPRDPSTIIDKLNAMARKVKAQIRRKEREGNINTQEEEKKEKQIDKLRNKVADGSTKLFDFGAYFQVVAENKEALREGTEELRQYLGQKQAQVTPLSDRQIEGFRTMAPLGKDRTKKDIIMDLKSLSTTFPFIEPARIHPNGSLFGFHETTNSPTILNPFELSGHNVLMTGKIGSGKSYLAKLYLLRMSYINPNLQISIIDPAGDFESITESLDGDTIELTGGTKINPLAISPPQGDHQEGTGRRDKIRSVMGFLKTHFGDARSLDKFEEGILRKALKYAYLEKGITKDPRTYHNENPTMQDVLDILDAISQGKQPEEFLDVDDNLKELVQTIDDEINTDSRRMREDKQQRFAAHAQQVLMGLDEFQEGGQWDMFNGKTNIDMDNDIVRFNLEDVVDANEQALVMHIISDFLFQRVKSTKRRSIVTIDEAHYLRETEGALNMLNILVRHSRHFNTGVQLLSQTVSEFMGGKSKEIYDQCDIKILMRHKDLGQEECEALDITEADRHFVLQEAQPGNKSGDYSSGLVKSDFTGDRRIRVFSNWYEHRVIDDDAKEPWTPLVENDVVSMEVVPPQKRDKVRKEIRESREENQQQPGLV